MHIVAAIPARIPDEHLGLDRSTSEVCLASQVEIAQTMAFLECVQTLIVTAWVMIYPSWALQERFKSRGLTVVEKAAAAVLRRTEYCYDSSSQLLLTLKVNRLLPRLTPVASGT